MFEYLYQWIENIAFFLLILTMAIQLIPNNSYKKYIHFFAGLVLIIMIVNPIIDLLGMGQDFAALLDEAQYQQKMKEIEEATKYLEDIANEME